MKAETYPFVMRPLPYEYCALAPCISAEALLYHHDRIYKNYVDKLNQALSDYPMQQSLSLKDLLAVPENLPACLRTAVINNGGGAYSHELYFDSMQPFGCEQDPKGALLEALVRDFGSLRDFRDRIKKAGEEHFSAGFAWLLLGQDGRLSILTTADQGTPDLKRNIPLLNVDVWEHAYYLQYQNRREDYLSAWLRLVNWRKVARRYEEGMMEVENRLLLCGMGEMLKFSIRPERGCGAYDVEDAAGMKDGGDASMGDDADRYVGTEYANAEYASESYADGRYANAGYASESYADGWYAGAEYGDEGNAGEGGSGDRYTDGRYADAGYAGASYGDEEFSGPGLCHDVTGMDWKMEGTTYAGDEMEASEFMFVP